MADDLKINIFKSMLLYQSLVGENMWVNQSFYPPDAIDIINYAKYRNDNYVDLNIERAIREFPGRRKLYFSSLNETTTEISVAAKAAANEDIILRAVGNHEVEIEKEDGVWYIIVSFGYNSQDEWSIEVRLDDGDGMRVFLGTPVRGTITLRVTQDNFSLLKLVKWISNPESKIWLTHTVGF